MEKFETPKIEMVQFDVEDVIATSGGINVTVDPCFDGGCGSDCNEFNVDF